jgi:methylenetetrahydrofolate dehydrogenase (NADP+)/methenyltetrahydrofolate cyclohydrolase
MPCAWATVVDLRRHAVVQHQARIMDGTTLAATLVAETAERATAFTDRTGRSPCLAAVLVGDDPSSVVYVRMKERRSATAGIASRVVRLPSTSTTAEVVATIADLSEDPTIDGILVQHPVPAHVDERAAFEAIRADKDVDGVTMHSLAAMALGLPGFWSCTPAGILRLLDEYDVDPSGRHAVVIGRSPILGLPVGMLLLARDATVTTCHSRTVGLADLIRSADIVVAAVGRPNFVRGDWLKPGAVVIDAGYSAGNVGDVAFDEAVDVAGFIAPVPGGVGPMTIATLLDQTVTAAEIRWPPLISETDIG